MAALGLAQSAGFSHQPHLLLNQEVTGSNPKHEDTKDQSNKVRKNTKILIIIPIMNNCVMVII